jgi:hypothetical protein
MVCVSSSDLSGGLFEYDTTVDNTGGLEPLQRMLLFNAGSYFGLDEFSVIGAPQDVGVNPLPMGVCLCLSRHSSISLSYFSRDPAGDIPIGGTLDRFTFQSFRDPSTVTCPDLQIDGVGRNSDT